MKLKPDAAPLDVLVQLCGSFRGSAQTNNGYGCAHPEQTSRDGETNEGQCMSFSCPLASQLNPSDEPLDVRALHEIGWSEEEIAEVSSETNLMLVHEPRVLVALRKRR